VFCSWSAALPSLKRPHEIQAHRTIEMLKSGKGENDNGIIKSFKKRNSRQGWQMLSRKRAKKCGEATFRGVRGSRIRKAEQSSGRLSRGKKNARAEGVGKPSSSTIA
jgi:hypothetical protein